MLTGEARHGLIRAERTADAAHLVRADGNADARAAYDNAAREPAVRHSLRYGESNIRIIHALFIRAAEIRHLKAELFNDGDQFHFERIAAVVRADRDFHSVSPLFPFRFIPRSYGTRPPATGGSCRQALPPAPAAPRQGWCPYRPNARAAAQRGSRRGSPVVSCRLL